MTGNFWLDKQSDPFMDNPFMDLSEVGHHQSSHQTWWVNFRITFRLYDKGTKSMRAEEDAKFMALVDKAISDGPGIEWRNRKDVERSQSYR